MDLRNFVRVVARHANGDEELGTGYRLCHDRVLTAYHVVEGAGEIKIELDCVGGAFCALKAELLWHDAELDVAVLLLCKLEPGLCPSFFHFLAHEPLDKTSTWESHGHALAAVEKKYVVDSLLSLSGEVQPFTSNQSHFDLTEVKGHTAEVHHWKGISGAPVFVKERIYGIITSAPDEFENRRFYATPVSLLMERQDFVEKLGLERGERWKKLIDRVSKLLAKNSDAAKTVAEQRDPWKQSYGGNDVEALASAILQHSSVEDVLVALNKAHIDLAASDSALTVVELLESIVPVLHDQHLVFSLPQGPGGALLQIPVSTPTIAEIVLAGVVGRQLRYRSLQQPGDWPVPEAHVGGVPESGIDAAGSVSYKEFVEHLARKFVPEEDRRILTRGGHTGERLYEGLARLVDGELEWQAKRPDRPLRYYLLFDSDFVKSHGELLPRIQRSMLNLQLVEMIGGDQFGERQLCRPLRDLLFRSQHPPAKEP